MRVNYKGRRGEETESAKDWILYNLQRNGIESQIAKLQNFCALIGDKWLAENADQVDKLANAIGADGYDHKVLPDEVRDWI